MGLPISQFAIIMVSVIGSLLVIIFSFGLGVVVTAMVFNSILYGAMTQFAQRRSPIQLQKTFPNTISNKKTSPFNYG